MFAERLVISLIVLILGMLFCFAGYRLFRVIMALWGFLIGFLIGAQLITSFVGNGVLTAELAWFVGIILGIILAVLAYALYTAAIVILGASIGYILGTGLMATLGIDQQEALVAIVGLILALLFAILILALDLVRLLIVTNTALGGAAATVVGILLLLGLIPPDFLQLGQVGAFIRDSPGWLMLWLLIAVAGGVFQLQNSRSHTLEKYTLARKAPR